MKKAILSFLAVAALLMTFVSVSPSQPSSVTDPIPGSVTDPIPG